MAPSLKKSALSDLQNDAVPSSVSLEGTTFFANGHPFLTHVPGNITSTPAPFTSKDPTRNTTGSFVGFHTDKLRSRHVAPIGKLRNIPFMSLFRFKVWWTTHWTGSNGSDVEHETQMMLLNKSDLGRPYVVLLPLPESPFGSSLQPGSKNDDVDVCVDSGSDQALGSTFRSCVYIHVGTNPYELLNDAVRAVKNHLGTFKLLEDKTVPSVVDAFGWCTWNAFYLKVNPQGIREGVRGLGRGGCPPRLVLIDDGWQSITCTNDPADRDEGVDQAVVGEHMASRLREFEENYKFRDYEGRYGKGMGGFVGDLKGEFGNLENVYVWHSVCGYWGGLRRDVMWVEDCEVVEPETTMEDLAVDQMRSGGVGVVAVEKVGEMYERLHSYLQAVGADGVKVDAIQIHFFRSFLAAQILELVGGNFGGRIELAKAYYKALTASMRKHFNGNGVIASMEQCNDFMYLGTEAIALARVGDDFWCTDPNGDPYWLQGLHMVHCAYNSLWMGNIVQPDWDMFQSTHPTAEFHAASRAISGGPIYVSDCVGDHDFVLLRKLVLPDGSILRCRSYALPTRDSLFVNPSHDGKSVLKIWNLNKFTGVLGAFNCQGGGWCRKSRQNKLHFEAKFNLTCLAGPTDIEWSNESGRSFVPIQGVRAFAVYMNRRKTMRVLKFTESFEITLLPFSYELLTVSPVRVVGRKAVELAPIGLVNMMNSGGAIESVEYVGENVVEIVVRGCGEMAIYASEKPRACSVDGVGVEFGYDERMVIVHVAWPGSPGLSKLRYLF
ncbi:hypothetical protein OSB04_004343 [Centaurea solstitialis]|uniref:galactinol--sucrose galactosyltransferase n=1 Tax=Centaurea solstitialis TaxID=347529 RepID=A0AA38UDC2_9ASTR|nr:hypothetical protein OSB04_004343 [Centaurea solstitialis]